MADWIVCPSCNLKHSRRPDGRCPRCHESVERAGAEPVSTAPPIEPGKAVAMPPAGGAPSTRPSSSAPPRPPRPTPAPSPAARPVPHPRPAATARTPLGAPTAVGDDTWIVRNLRSRATRGLASAAALLALVALLFSAQIRYFHNFFGGPYPVSAADLDAMRDISRSPRYYVHVEGSRAADLGIQVFEVETSNGRETSRRLKASFFALEVGDRFLVVRSAAGPTNVVEGELKPIDAELDQHLFSDPQMRTLRARFQPNYLDTGSFRENGYIGLAAGATSLLALGFWAVRSWRRRSAAGSLPLVARVAQWGDPATVSAEVEGETARPWKKSGSFVIGDRYVVKSAFYSFDVLRLCDLLWAYKKVIKKSVNFVPVGKDYHAVLRMVGGTVEVNAKDAEIDQVLEYAAARAPWAVFGHTKELEQLFTKDAAGFVAGVAERRRRFEAESAATPKVESPG